MAADSLLFDVDTTHEAREHYVRAGEAWLNLAERLPATLTGADSGSARTGLESSSGP